MNFHEVILRVGAGGGSLGILGNIQPDGTWTFQKERNEALHANLLSEEDAEGLSFEDCGGSANSFSEALALLSEYPWHRLYPLNVHPEFRQAVFDAVMELTARDGEANRNIYEWKQECGMPLD